jgi:uncharacterized OB-fold protein
MTYGQPSYGLARALPGDQIKITTNPDTEPFWEAAKAHKLTACQCGECGKFRMPPTPICPECGSREKNWPALPGTATVFSYVVCNKNPANGEDYVYVPIVVDVDGAPGARLNANLTGCDAEDAAIGMKVSVDWMLIQDGWVLPNFRKV